MHNDEVFKLLNYILWNKLAEMLARLNSMLKVLAFSNEDCYIFFYVFFVFEILLCWSYQPNMSFIGTIEFSMLVYFTN